LLATVGIQAFFYIPIAAPKESATVVFEAAIAFYADSHSF
jgi:hypothetical protein